MSALQSGDVVLVTGVSGYIGSRVAEELVAAGYQVRGTSRTSTKAQWLVDYLDRKFGSGKIQIVEVPDMLQSGAYDNAVKGVSGVIHLASVLTFSTDVDEVVGPSVKGLLNVFHSATTEPKIKSFVYTSSSVACALPHPGERMKITKETFNEASLEAAYKPDPTAFDVYAASKAAAEKALWAAVKRTSPTFQVATVLPDANFGRLLRPDETSTGRWITDLYEGIDYPLNLPSQFFIDVGDDAKLHVAALIDPACNGQRIFAFAESYTWTDILDIFRKLYPDKSFLEGSSQGEVLVEVPNGEAENLLRKHYGHGWTSLEESVKQGLDSVLAH